MGFNEEIFWLFPRSIPHGATQPGPENQPKAAWFFREADTGFRQLRRGIRLFGTTVAP
jgi:hypothetical protein